MGTRGTLGLFIDGKTKATYNHFDSYPSALGVETVKAVREVMADPERGVYWLKDKARAIVMLSETPEIPADAQKKLKPFINNSVGGSDAALYRLTREMQGKILTYLETGYMPEGGEAFLGESLFCEFAYIINLDDCQLEMYKGFQDRSHEKGRYASMGQNERSKYYPVALVGSFPLDAIPDDWMRQAFPEDAED